MTKQLKISLLFLSFCLVTGCLDKVDKKEAVVEQEEKTIFLKDDKYFLKKEIEKEIDKNFGKSFEASTSVKVKNKAVSIVDLDQDGLFDAVVFLNLFNKKGDVFYNTSIIYYKNTGEAFLKKDTLVRNEYMYPSEQENYSGSRSAYTREIKPIEGHVDISKKGIKGSFALDEDGELYYGVITSQYSYDISLGFEVIDVSYYMYVTAESGLLYRDEPDGEVVGKFPYGTVVHVIGETALQKTIYEDDGGQVTGQWVLVEIGDNSEKSAYVFDGFLDVDI